MNTNTIKTTTFTLLTAILVAVLTVTISAQSGTTGIKGAIKDQQGAAVPGATVILTNPNTGFNRTVTSTDDGIYTFPGIAPGTYQIEVTAGNFKKAVVSGIKALVDNPIEVNIPLEPGNVSVTVNVTADDITSIVNTQDASLGNNFVPQQITQLPTDLRNVADLLTLQPGVTREGYVAGARSDQSNITLDGVASTISKPEVGTHNFPPVKVQFCD